MTLPDYCADPDCSPRKPCRDCLVAAGEADHPFDGLTERQVEKLWDEVGGRELPEQSGC